MGDKPVLPRDQQPKIRPSHLGFPVVGIGASAGGIAALQGLFQTMPAEPGMAFVIVLHLSPAHASSLDAIIQRATRMPVRQLSQAVPIEKNHIYVIPPAKMLQMNDGYLRLRDPLPRETRHSTIDQFFRSLADAHQSRSICVILSGTGSDGTQGLKQIKEQGGISLVQSPEDCEYDAMPRNAIETGLVDFVLPAAQMPQRLVDLWANASRVELPTPPDGVPSRPPADPDSAEQAEEALIAIKRVLRDRTGHDFTHYKRATVLRRLERRLQVTGLPGLPQYAEFLSSTPAETPALLQDMLISVTNFFRDRDAFDALERHLRESFEERPPPAVFRIWTAGCATGEEAYSVAISVNDVLRDGDPPPSLQVFASDIDQKALAVARAGIYSSSIASDMSAQRLQSYFSTAGDHTRVAKSIRDLIVFSAHNVLRDPPFTRLDLLCCRNLLIYLDQRAQRQLLENFHYALKPGGFLFLGSAETADQAADLFTIVDKKYRIYQARTTERHSRAAPTTSNVSTLDGRQWQGGVDASPSAPIASVHRRLLDQLGPASAVVNAQYNVLHVDERASRLMQLSPGVPTADILKLVRPELRTPLRTALFKAAESSQSVEAQRTRLTLDGRDFVVSIHVHPTADPSSGRSFLVLFALTAMTLDAGLQGGPPGERDAMVEALEAEVVRLKESLSGTLGESAASTEELRASNEELQTINEELRSATEELETSKEEIQSINEELLTVNTELSNKVDEMTKVNDDLQNLITSTDIGTVFVDRSVRIKRFTPPAARLFNLISSDAGRPLLDINHKLDYADLLADVTSTLTTLRPTEREVRALDGSWFLVRMLPYRTSEDRIDGAVLNFIDITARRNAEDNLLASEQRLRLVADSMNEYAIITTDPQGIVNSWSRGAEKLFGYTAQELAGRDVSVIFTPEDVAAHVPQQEMDKARTEGRAEDNRWQLHKDGHRLFVSGIMRPLMQDDRLQGYAKIAQDMTAAKLAETERDAARLELENANLMKDEFFAVMSHELKNPLNLIQIMVEMLARSPQTKDIALVQRSTTTIKRTIASQAQIINDLLDLSRLNTGKLNIKPARVGLAPLLKQMSDAFRDTTDAKEQKFSMRVAPEAVVFADPVRVEQIVWNLVSNASKFTPEGGYIDLDVTLEGSRARIQVTDDGIGIDPRMLQQVFDLYQQAGSGIGLSKGGLGIGLALVKRLSALQGGEVRADSKGPKKGSTFTVWLPLYEGGDAQNVKDATGIASWSGVRVLWVDDDGDILEMLRELLTQEGARVVTASDGAKAIEIAQAQVFDVVLSDIAMPIVDGYELITALRRQEGTRDAVAIAVTGFGREGDRAKALAAGFDAHLSKPFELESLLATIRHVHRTRD